MKSKQRNIHFCFKESDQKNKMDKNQTTTQRVQEPELTMKVICGLF